MSALDGLRALIAEVVREEVRHALADATKPTSSHLNTVKAYSSARSISVSTVRAAIREGRLPAVRVGRAVRIPADAELSRPISPKQTATRTSRADRILGIAGVRR